ncbi:MAG: N-acetyl-gamma-glutamyl-phosphate reductase [Paracoccaceae bacterium]
MARAAILGASGYTGAELLRLLAGHPTIEVAALTGHSKAGQPIEAVYPHLRGLGLPPLTTIDEVDWAGVDLAFCALPHATSQAVVAGLPEGVRVVDLSADFRLRDVEAYARWYGQPHAAPRLQAQAVYGLTEFYRDDIRGARLVAGTGCNAATGQYVLRPPLEAGVIDPDRIVLDLKCGVSGAGRSLKQPLLHAELSEGVGAYAPGSTHRHLAEFDQELSAAAGRQVRIQFTPHLVPMNRGILATCWLDGDAATIHATLAARYAAEAFVSVLPLGQLPATRDVRGSNHCHIGVVADRTPGRALAVAVLDNLTKGSSGQAVQNANLMLGLPEGAGLTLAPLFP